MLITGIIVSIFSLLLVIFPKFFLNIKAKGTAFLQMKKLNNNKKVIVAVRIWGIICFTIGIVLIIVSLK